MQLTLPPWGVRLPDCVSLGLLVFAVAAGCAPIELAPETEAAHASDTRSALHASADEPSAATDTQSGPSADAVDPVAKLRQSLSRSPENLRIHRRPDGLHDVEVRSGFQHMTLLVKQDDGTLVRRCTNDADEAAHLLGADAK